MSTGPRDAKHPGNAHQFIPSAADVGKLVVPEALGNDARRLQTRLFQTFKAGK